ncbi:MAG: hypothetical protein LLG06_10605 [Desulfobacteraceae bacterium]|nr:hypothetical protein [Desulfobacteraceae bacterium]
MANRTRIFLVLFTVLICIGVDQISKEFVRSHLPRTRVVLLAGGALRLDYAENKGAVFSFE